MYINYNMKKTSLLEDVHNNFKSKDKINILEIGTGDGDNSTKILYNFFKEKYTKINLLSYEGYLDYFRNAESIWKNSNEVTIVNEYFCKKEDIKNLLIPNIPNYIIDYKESGERLKNKYRKLYNDKDIKNYIKDINFVPDIIFIDCSRFMHLPIINLCYELFKENSNCLFIMEEDYFCNNICGELAILQKYFKLININKYNKTSWQTGTLRWPFITFNIENKLI